MRQDLWAQLCGGIGRGIGYPLLDIVYLGTKGSIYNKSTDGYSELETPVLRGYYGIITRREEENL
jgi:hypothetical protein